MLESNHENKWTRIPGKNMSISHPSCPICDGRSLACSPPPAPKSSVHLILIPPMLPLFPLHLEIDLFRLDGGNSIDQGESHAPTKCRESGHRWFTSPKTNGRIPKMMGLGIGGSFQIWPVLVIFNKDYGLYAVI